MASDLFRLGLAALLVLSFAGFLGLDARVQRLASRVAGRFWLADRFFRLITRSWLAALVLVLIPGLGFVLAGEFSLLVPLIAGPWLALGLAFLGKYLFMRSRPAGFVTFIGRADSSFPSAHAAGAFGAAGFWLSFDPRLGLLAAGYAFFVGLSRIYLGRHFLSDVAAGALLGLLVATLAWQEAARYFQLA